MENKFTDICTFEVLYKAYLAARRGKRSRAATAHYEVHLLENIVNLVYILTTKTYRPGVFRVFYVYEPKKRLVQAPAFVDKVVQHAVVDNILYERITNSFILDNYASQKNKGLHFGLVGCSNAMCGISLPASTMTGSRKSSKSWALSLRFMTFCVSMLTAQTVCRLVIRQANCLPCTIWMSLTTL